MVLAPPHGEWRHVSPSRHPEVSHPRNRRGGHNFERRTAPAHHARSRVNATGDVSSMEPRAPLPEPGYPRGVQRVSVVGNSGSGKTWLAKRVADILDVPF